MGVLFSDIVSLLAVSVCAIVVLCARPFVLSGFKHRPKVFSHAEEVLAVSTPTPHHHQYPPLCVSLWCRLCLFAALSSQGLVVLVVVPVNGQRNGLRKKAEELIAVGERLGKNMIVSG